MLLESWDKLDRLWEDAGVQYIKYDFFFFFFFFFWSYYIATDWYNSLITLTKSNISTHESQLITCWTVSIAHINGYWRKKKITWHIQNNQALYLYIHFYWISIINLFIKVWRLMNLQNIALINVSQLAKMKKHFPYMSLPQNL